MTRSPDRRSPRIFTSTETRGLEPDDINRLFKRAGLPPRDPEKWQTSLKYSLFCITAREITTRELVGFMRASGDGVFNVTLWDFVVDPRLKNQEETQEMILDRLQREVQRSFSRCSVSLLAKPRQLPLLRRANFAEERQGIRAMALRQNSIGYRLRQLRTLDFDT
ncbi:MAG: hypothetical protein VKJ85_05765 [Prochlorothrix sp.]|nr:hypothetical protein [Prochlorothrix sp.]